MDPKADPKAHWEKVYTTKAPDEVSWYRPHLEMSLSIIEHASPHRDARIIDVGGGHSTLVDDLLAMGYKNVSVMDLSGTALEMAQDRLHARAASVGWLCGDVLSFDFARHAYDVWHDRAVFHFLTDPADRLAYVRQVSRAVKPGGHVIVAAFGPEGPEQCSGLNVVRYDADGLHEQFGPAFELEAHVTDLHRTPTGSVQQFVYCYCKLALPPS